MKKSFIFLHTAVLLGGLTGILGKLITINAAALVGYRVALSSLLLYGILKATKQFKHYSRKEMLQIGASGIMPCLFWAFFYASIKYSNVSIGVVCFCLTGFFTAVISPVVNRQKLNVSELFLSALTLAGVSLIFHFDTKYRTGIILGTISSFFGALYIMCNEKLVKRYDTRMINYYQLVGATISLLLFLPLYIYYSPGQKLLPTAADWMYLLILSLFCTVGLYLLIAEALKDISAFTVNLSFNLEPVYSILLAMLLFKENKTLDGSFYLGLSLILLSVLLQMLKYLPSKTRG